MHTIKLLLVLSLLFIPFADAQQWVNPHFDAHRMDYRDLGYPQQNIIPADNSPITALMRHSNGFIYGATSGKTQSYLFFYNRYINKVRPLGQIANAKAVHHCLIEGADGAIFIGTGLNMFAPVKLTKDFPVAYEAVEKQLWSDIVKPYEGFEGGHIYKYDPKTGDTQRYRTDDATPLEDLGIPVPGETVYAMTMNPSRSMIYGITYPNAHFFSLNLETGEKKDFGEILRKRVFNGPVRHWRTVPRALLHRYGHIYTSGNNGVIIKIRPQDGKITLTNMRLPGEYWEGLKSMDYPVVESFACCGPEGAVYAGTSDGYVLRMDGPDKLTVLGKPRVQRRIRGMSVGLDKRLYIVTGEIGKSAKLHTYDLAGGRGFTELGVLAVDRSPYYQQRAYNVDAMAVGPDGTVFIGESDRRAKLFLYTPPLIDLLQIFKEGYNPTNPVVERMRDGTPGLIKESL